MRKKRLLILLVTFISILILSYIFQKRAINSLSEFLSKSEQVNANILLVEGWLPYDALKTAADEFKKNGYDYLITTGLKSTTDYFEVTMNGYLIFYSKSKFADSSKSGKHLIEAMAYSELDGDNSAHFNLLVNNSLVASFYADKRIRKYSVTWNGPLSRIDSIMVQFDNDKIGDFGDRNLYVKEIIIDHKLVIPYLNNSAYYLPGLKGRNLFINNFNSNAGQAKDRLISMGVDSSRIIAVPGKRVLINRTLTSALAARDWFNTSDTKVIGINIISSGTHARRTWMTYNKVLKKSYKIGIISLTDQKNNFSSKRKVLKTLRETIAIIYYWIILIPY